ncbi:MAG: nucleoside hydrolase [Pseudomonadota bacterium]
MHKIIIDSDPGVDDAVAIFLALASPEIELVGITTVAGNVGLDRVHNNAKRLLALVKRPDIPLVKGCSHPIMTKCSNHTDVHGEDGLAGIPLPESNYPEHSGHAVDFIIDTVMSNPGEITLCPIAPLTNIAIAMIKEPRLADNIKNIVLMGGAAFTQGNVTPAAEFNFYVDPHAAHIVFENAHHVTMLGLDVTTKADIRSGLCNSLEKQGHIAQITAAMSRKYAKFDPFLHDPCVIAYLIQPEIFSSVEGNIYIEYGSKTLFGHSLVTNSTKNKVTKPKCTIVTDVDSSKLMPLIAERIGTLG